ncbi:MAG TPA: ATP12 family protein [Rhizomicrobium sp.]|nr:ATP12 family protein [Rhizomicrobium sp.]
MKRFYENVTVSETPEGFRFLLDGKPVQTPARQALVLPNRALAEALAEEWRVQGAEMQPLAMPLTRLVNTVVDGVRAKRNETIAAILRFGENDLLSYRAEAPAELTRRQGQWNAWLDWAHKHHGARLDITSGIGHVGQSPEALAALHRAIAAQDDYALAALHTFSSITGSLVLGLAALEGELTPEEAFALSRLDEDYQAEQWGADREAQERAARLAREMELAARLVLLSRT